jgi:PAS domain-containing protein
MQLVLHTGAHYTEQERLIKSVLRNNDELTKRGIMVPGPNSYRGLVRDALNAMRKIPASPEAREVLLDAIIDGAPAERMILSDANFFRTAGTAIQQGVIYPAAAARMAHMAKIFAEDEVEIFVGIRNPATFVPVLYKQAVDNSDVGFWGGRRPQDLRWSDTLREIREMAPSIAIRCWCYEDTPVLWSQIIRDMTGIADDEKIVGGFDLLSTIMNKEGMERLRSYLHGHQDMNESQKRRVIGAFLDKFAIEDQIEEELDMPGWTESLVDELTDLYDEDVAVIETIEGVRMITV